MPGPANTLLIEGSFAELSEELAQYIDNIKKTEEGSGVQAEIAPTIAKLRESDQSSGEPSEANEKEAEQQRTTVLKSLVQSSAVLNSAPEKGVLSDSYDDSLTKLSRGTSAVLYTDKPIAIPRCSL